MKKLTACLLSLALVLALCGFAAAEAYPEYHWTAPMTVSETTINYMIMEKFANLLSERSDGKVTIDLYPGGQLGNDNEMFQGVRDGTFDMLTSMSSGMVDFVPEAGIFDLPNLFPSVEAMRAVLSGDFMKEFNAYCNKGGYQLLGFSDAGFRQLTSNKEQTSGGRTNTGVIDAFVGCLTSGRAPEIDGREAAKAMRVIFAAEQSAREQRTVTVSHP